MQRVMSLRSSKHQRVSQTLLRRQVEAMHLPALLKQIARLFEKRLANRAFFAVTQLGELLQLRSLRRIELGRHFDINAHMQIPMAITLNIFDPLAFKPEHRARLSAGRNADRSLP